MGSFGNNPAIMAASDNPDGLISQLSSDAKKRYFVMFMEFGTLICGLLCLAAGFMGIYWGSAVIKPWPPLTWNNCVGGFFMVVFGTAMACLGLAGFSKAASGNETGGEQAGMITREAKFLDVFAGRGVFFFGIANIVVHGFVIIGAKNACKQLNYVSAVIGLVVMVAGGMGFYWGTKVIKPWPPLTWNNCVGGIFMFFFGLVVLYICMKGDDPNAVMLQKYFRFLDVFIGRGCFFMFIGLRIIPLGQFYCLVAGMVTFSFGVLNCAIHWIFNADGDAIRISTTEKVKDVK